MTSDKRLVSVMASVMSVEALSLGLEDMFSLLYPFLPLFFFLFFTNIFLANTAEDPGPPH